MEEIIEINDIREQNDFKGISFSEFKKTDVLKELIKSINDNKLESVCYWTAELVSAGHYMDLWNIIIFYFAKYIHLGNVKVVSYLDMKCEKFKKLVKNGYSGQELRLRNNTEIRNMFGEIVYILCSSNKKNPLSEIKISSSNNYYKYKAPDLTLVNEFLVEEDLKDLIVPLNELIYQIRIEQNSVETCYWMEWLFEFERKSKKEKINILGRRDLKQVDSKFQKDMCFCIWDILLTESKEFDKLTFNSIKSSFNLFCLGYTPGTLKKRKLLLYFSIELLTSPFVNVPILDDKSKLENLSSNLNIVYKQIKKNEKSPNTDYLFNNEKANNLEKTIAKLDAMNNFEDSFIPRI